ncbi:DNA/RNA endonuclease G, NUC1 [Caballeronia glathei]|jgi:endonuclease G|uniref:Endonuclease n=1 Tax=Caballeronia glathei TaxID=60547 RepID=A0A069PKM0_9BURK|nr:MULTISPECIES: DNA/RNA non-specific endonuclease [Burkholderiaceae]KDR41243.1 endonuclease [Caballeronia glathei]TCK38240.1 endonuclease G [Paraburkholderia sp. BL8N3]CDY76026.1 DNA/RNA endonuclease G, NUC1 [Caballeronia glathei]
MKARFKAFAAALLGASCLTAALAASASTDCPQFSPDGRAPVVANAKMRASTQEICYSDFAVLHSGVTHGPLWSAEHLTARHVDDAKNNTRTNRFYAERKLPPGDSAQLSDYKRSGYDRGHMSPAGDRWSKKGMAESFSLANIVPQNPSNNRRIWSRIEEAVRRLVEESGDAYVVTGPIFSGRQLQTIGESRVFVPTQLYKVVYLPSRQLAFAVVVENVPTDDYAMKTVHELEAMSGLQFPGIPEALKDKRLGGLKGV